MWDESIVIVALKVLHYTKTKQVKAFLNQIKIRNEHFPAIRKFPFNRKQ